MSTPKIPFQHLVTDSRLAILAYRMAENIERTLALHPNPEGRERSASEINAIISEIREANAPLKRLLGGTNR
jgi:hypothetical protein